MRVIGLVSCATLLPTGSTARTSVRMLPARGSESPEEKRPCERVELRTIRLQAT